MEKAPGYRCETGEFRYIASLSKRCSLTDWVLCCRRSMASRWSCELVRSVRRAADSRRSSLLDRCANLPIRLSIYLASMLMSRSAVDPPSALLLHFLHPLSRSLHMRLYTSLLGLSSTLSALALAPEPGMGVAEQEMVDLAGKVVEDAVRGAAGGLEKWKSVLEKVADIEGLVGGKSSGNGLYTEFD